jgi:hypothetical protein
MGHPYPCLNPSDASAASITRLLAICAMSRHGKKKRPAVNGSSLPFMLPLRGITRTYAASITHSIGSDFSAPLDSL